MSQIQLVVRDAFSNWKGKVSTECCDRVIAALGDDPATMEELTNSLKQYEEASISGLDGRMELIVDPNQLEIVEGVSNGGIHGSGVVIIDLEARLIAFESTRWAPEKSGWVSYHNGRFETDIELEYLIADDWHIMSTLQCWREVAQRRRLAHSALPRIDYRTTLYGEELYQFIATEVLRSTQVGDRQEEYYEIENVISELHERWLLQPREEWSGNSAREVMMSRFDYINASMEHRCMFWSTMEHPPEPLSTSSKAYLYSGWGNHEFIMYYDYVRHLMLTCWKWIALEDAIIDEDGENELVARLRDEATRWLQEPIEDFHGRAPKEIIERERRRMPEVVSPEEAILDCDCPLCRMMAEMPGVSFWHLDGSHLDPELAFSMDTLWDGELADDSDRQSFREAVQKALESKSNQVSVESQVQTNRGNFGLDLTGIDGVAEPLPPIVQFFGIGCKLGELITALKEPVEQRPLIDALMQEWTLLRSCIGEGESLRKLNAIDQRLGLFHATIDAVLDSNPNLEGLAVELHKSLDRLELHPTPMRV